jgi:hypothetical protein
MQPEHIKILELVTQLLNTAGLGVPIIFAGVTAISAIIKGLTGSGATLLEQADVIEAQLNANDPKLAADVARYRATLGV